MQTRSPGLRFFTALPTSTTGAGCFMAKDHRFFHDEWADSTVFIVMNVTSADSYRVNPDLYVVGTNFGW